MIANQSERLDRVAAAAMQFDDFDAERAIRDDQRSAWARWLIYQQGFENAYVRPQDRAAMTQAGLSDDQIEAVQDTVVFLKANNQRPRQHALHQLIEAQRAVNRPQ